MSSQCNRHERGPFRALCLGLVAVAALLAMMETAPAEPSRAQRQATAREYYKKGSIQYDLGNFEQAIEHFKKAYEVLPHESFLFNIAQSYRLMNDCKNALFFYKRYLSLAGAGGRNSDQVQQYIKELGERCKEDPRSADSPGRKPNGTGDDAQRGDDGASSNAPGTMGELDDGGSGPAAGRGATGIAGTAGRGGPHRASVLASSFELGPAFLGIGDLDITGAQFSLGIGAGYPLERDRFGLTVGALFTYTPVPWTNQVTSVSGTSSLTSLLLNIGARYWLLDRLAVRGELGAGGLFLGGLEDGNVFVPPGSMATGTLSMFNVRVGIGAELLLTRNLVLSAAPAVYSYSAAKAGLRQEIDAFTRFELMAGIGYRL